MPERVAVCLASSFLGHYAHAGFLNGLAAAGVVPARLSGCSAGALAGGLWAGGLRGEELEEEICRFNFRRSFFDLKAPLRLPGVATWSYANGILGGSRLRRRLVRQVGEPRLEEMKSPTFEVAVANLSRGVGEVRREGPLVDLVLASLAMPLIFRARKIDGEWLADGGVSNETPFTHWLDDATVDRIVVHRIRYPEETPRRMGPGGVIARCHTVSNAELEGFRLEQAAASGKALDFIETELAMPRVFHRSADGRRMIVAGREAAGRWARGREEAA